ncbi:MAG TPA: DNA gyrase inhibitor YacG [Methylomirabilota bacterium]|jgi:hypothetical protein|nr:DNA gyrase inhibitor YacG [Methylomirabilota bacterium]
MSGADEVDHTRRERSVRCPHCGTRAPWAGNPNRPFCSLTCRLIDLGDWLDERYRIPGPRRPDDGLEGE